MSTVRNLVSSKSGWVAIFMACTIATLPVRTLCSPLEAEEDFFDMDLEDLVQEPYRVVSAARRSQKQHELGVPVTVITAEQIHYSGHTTIPDILASVPGMDVLRADRNRYIVGVRGLHQSLADRTLVLINGRNAGSPIFGGADFTRLPVLMEDIDRIEVVRGPGGAAWGANAFNGVINIITKKPADVQGVLGSTTLNEFGDHYNQLRWGHQQGPFTWRISSGYQNQSSSDHALDGDRFVSKDFRRSVIFDTDGHYRINNSTDLNVGIAFTDIERGSFDFTGLGMGIGNEHITGTRLFARFEKEHENGSSAYVQWFGNFDTVKRPSMYNARTSENDLELQYDFVPWRAHALSVGGNVRMVRINTDRSDPAIQINYPREPFDESVAGIFLIDRWQVTNRLTIESQMRGDTYSEINEDWSARLSALYGLDDQNRHTLRASAARAFRTPLAALREMTYTPPPPGFGVTFLGPTPLDNEEIVSLEMGYTGRLTDTLSLEANAYAQRYRKLIGNLTLAPPPFGLMAFDNVDGGDALGTEIQLTWQGKSSRISAWYAYNDFDPDQKDQSIRAFGPAPHKLGINARLSLKEDWVLSSDYRFVDTTPYYKNSFLVTDIDDYSALDLALVKKWKNNGWELLFGIKDLFDETGGAVRENAGVAHPTPGRIVYARAQVSF